MYTKWQDRRLYYVKPLLTALIVVVASTSNQVEMMVVVGRQGDGDRETDNITREQNRTELFHESGAVCCSTSEI